MYLLVTLLPELNLIEQFWSVIKSSVKREFIYSKKDAISQIIADVSNQVAQPFEGFARYSVKRFADCLAGYPI